MISARKNKEVSLVTIIEKLTLEVNNMKKEISDLKEIVNIQTDIIENLVNNNSNKDTNGESFSLTDSSTKNTPSKVNAPLEQHELVSNSRKSSADIELRKNTNKQSQKYPVRQKGYLKSTHSSRKDSKKIISNKRIY